MNTIKLVNYYKGCDGLKTGYTDNAGSSLAVTAKREGLRLIAITFGYKNTSTRNREAVSLLDYGFSQYASKTILEKGKIVKQINLAKADKNKINLILKENANVVTRVGANSKTYTYSIKLNDISYPIKKGDTIGKLYLKDGSKIVKDVDLVSDADIRKAGLFKQYFGVISDMFSGNVY